MEVWKDIVGYEGLYQVSNKGRVRNTKTNRILKPWLVNEYYEVVQLGANNKKLVHRLVAEAFIPNPQNKPQVDHIKPVSKGGGNNAENLRWATPHENNMNEHTLKNMSMAKKGCTSPMKGKLNRSDISKPLDQIDKLTGEVVKSWKSTMDVKRNLGFDNGNISKCCNGKLKSYKDFVWKHLSP